MVTVALILTVLVALLFVLVLPGLCLSFILYDFDSPLNILERGVLSCALSMSIVPILLYSSSLIGIKISTLSVLTEILVLVLVAECMYLSFKRKRGGV